MHWLQVSYTIWHNARHERVGHLFQGRFKAFLIQGESYFQRLMLYVHRNPLRAGLVTHLRDYRWSSYRALAYGRRTPDWFDPGLTYRQLDIDAPTFRRAVTAYEEQKDALWTDLYYGLVLGSRGVVTELRRRLGSSKDQERPQWRQLQSAIDLRERIAECAHRLRVRPQEREEIYRPVRGRSRPRRDVLIYLLWSDGRCGLAEITGTLNVTYGAVSAAKARGEKYLGAHPRTARAWHIPVIRTHPKTSR